MLAVGLVASSAAVLAVAPGASAHSVLLSSSPEDKATLSTAPTEVVLTFNEPIQGTTMQLAVTGAAETSVTTQKPTVAGTVITQKLPADLPNDVYTVAYRVISVDGHPVAKSLSFTVNDPSSTAAPITEGPPSGSDGKAAEPSASGSTSTLAKVLYVVLPLLAVLLLIGTIKTKVNYARRNPREADLPPPQMHSRPNITRDRES
jgi:methionine-rich copper-binding protein CopC